MMLNHMGESAVATKIRTAYDAVLSEGKSLTRDLGGTATTDQFADALITHLK
jgi:isocitrate dehydrogenase (NAD+)